ncbi:hypothetical protein [Chthonobacter rhizosphaerae]|uniref:hypothetical protein n=1 Tax=Chthonobacter rhizosphaerae TaxID=2735553 RepID=UPI001AEE6DED|nr:hypothetical protein [Chthonobacter rhizosphaerae]
MIHLATAAFKRPGCARRIGAAALAAAILALSAGQAAAERPPMTSAEIKRTVNGKRIYLQTPFGGEFPLYYRADGVVDGSGEALGLGRFMAPKDSGKWWVKDDRLCQQWQEWYDAKQQCFILERTGDTTLYWKRDDGLEGEARVGQ